MKIAQMKRQSFSLFLVQKVNVFESKVIALLHNKTMLHWKLDFIRIFCVLTKK